MKISGHKCISSLSNYDPATTLDKRSDIAAALMMTDPVPSTTPSKPAAVDDVEDSFTGFSTQVPRETPEAITFPMVPTSQPTITPPQLAQNLTPMDAGQGNILTYLMREEDLKALDLAGNTKKDETIEQLINHILKK